MEEYGRMPPPGWCSSDVGRGLTDALPQSAFVSSVCSVRFGDPLQAAPPKGVGEPPGRGWRGQFLYKCGLSSINVFFWLSCRHSCSFPAFFLAFLPCRSTKRCLSASITPFYPVRSCTDPIFRQGTRAAVLREALAGPGVCSMLRPRDIKPATSSLCVHL